MHSAQEIPQIDADLSRRSREIAEKGHFWMKTSWERRTGNRQPIEPSEDKSTMKHHPPAIIGIRKITALSGIRVSSK